MPVAAASATKAGPNLASLSRIRCMGCWPNGVASRSCWVTQASVGWRVTCTMRRVASSRTKKAWIDPNSRSVTGRKAQVPMPAQQGVGLHNEQALAPGVQPAGQQDQQRPVDAGATRTRDTASQDNQLLSEKRVLGDEFRLAADEVGKCTGDERGRDRSGGGQQATMEDLRGAPSDREEATEWADVHDELFLQGGSGRRCRMPGSHLCLTTAKEAQGKSVASRHDLPRDTCTDRLNSQHSSSAAVDNGPKCRRA
jgi:hypothetical protein